MGKCGVLALVFFFAVGAAWTAQDKPETKDPCDMATVLETQLCSQCDVLDPKLDAKGNCEICGAPSIMVAACTKDYYVWVWCNKQMASDERCHRGFKNRKHTVKAKLVYRCEGCGAAGDFAWPCENEECRRLGRWIELTCGMSGQWPHGGEVPGVKMETP